MKGFVASKVPTRSASYWIACYSQDNEDEPIAVHKKVLTLKAGQNKDKLIFQYCRELMKINQSIWEILVHQGVSAVPDHGDQITLRMSRQKFRGSTTVM
jgi:hypothetical protein